MNHGSTRLSRFAVGAAAAMATLGGIYITSDIKRREACAAWAHSFARGVTVVRLMAQQQQEASSLASVKGETMHEGLVASVTRLIIQSTAGVEVLTPSAQLQLASDKSFLDFLWACNARDVLMRLFTALPPRSAINILATSPSLATLASFCEDYIGGDSKSSNFQHLCNTIDCFLPVDFPSLRSLPHNEAAIERDRRDAVEVINNNKAAISATSNLCSRFVLARTALEMAGRKFELSPQPSSEAISTEKRLWLREAEAWLSTPEKLDVPFNFSDDIIADYLVIDRPSTIRILTLLATRYGLNMSDEQTALFNDDELFGIFDEAKDIMDVPNSVLFSSLRSPAHRDIVYRWLSAVPLDDERIDTLLAAVISLGEDFLGVTDYELFAKTQLQADSPLRMADDITLVVTEASEKVPLSVLSREELLGRISILAELASSRVEYRERVGEALGATCLPLCMRLLPKGNDLVTKCAANVVELLPATSKYVPEQPPAELDDAMEGVEAYYELRRLRENISGKRVLGAPQYVEGVLPLICDASSTDYDIVFVHGLQGGLYTWREEPSWMRDFRRKQVETEDTTTESGPQFHWPWSSSVKAEEAESHQWDDWEKPVLWPVRDLSPLFPRASIFAFAYDAPVFSFMLKGPYVQKTYPTTLQDISDLLVAGLARAGIGRNGRPVVFVAHSLGGLIVKSAILKDHDLQSSTKAICFYATPHGGSPLALRSERIILSMLFPEFVRELSPNSEWLSQLNDNFAKQDWDQVDILSIAESAVTSVGGGVKVRMVPRESASLIRMGEFVDAPPGVDHIGVCKVNASDLVDDVRFTKLVELLRRFEHRTFSSV